jgi:linearmycin/streptolysin S transport system permease protein
MMFSILMGLMMGSFVGGGSGSKPAVVVFDSDRSAASASLIDSIRENENYRIVVADSSGSIDLARTLVVDGDRTATLLVPQGYADSLAADAQTSLAFFHDSDRLSAQSARTALEAEVIRINSLMTGHRIEGPEPFNTTAFDSLWQHPRLILDTSNVTKRTGPELTLDNAKQHVGPSYTLMFVVMFMLMSVRDVVEERRNGTMRRLRLGSASPALLVAGMLLGPLIVGLFQMAILLLLNSLVLGIDYGDSPGALIILALLFTGVATSLALLVATFCRTPGQADGIGMSMSMLLAALGGLWWPLEIVPDFMQKIGMILPTGRGITVFHEMIGRGYGVAENMPHFTWLAVTMILLLTAAVFRYRKLID